MHSSTTTHYGLQTPHKLFSLHIETKHPVREKTNISFASERTRIQLSFPKATIQETKHTKLTNTTNTKASPRIHNS